MGWCPLISIERVESINEGGKRTNLVESLYIVSNMRLVISKIQTLERKILARESIRSVI